MYALIDISNQMLEDSAFDMEGEIRGEATEQLAAPDSGRWRSLKRTLKRLDTAAAGAEFPQG